MTPTPTSVVIHGHFYQPPREDPWSGQVEAQPSAAPFHDWNVRVERECYRAVVAARVPGRGGRIQTILNTLNFLSFNFGPTLLAWMETEAQDTYRAIIEADRVSSRAFRGHGNAMAQAYHHAILPLASRRDKVTEVRWGMEDFRRRFRREAAGMWLPETAVDGETLDVLASEGIAFTIVAPHQVDPVPEGGLPGRYRTSSGKSIALFVYDGPLSHDVAFGPLLKDGAEWADRLVGRKENPALVSIATDGETYGHHHRFGEMALARLLEELRGRPEIRVENFASFLARTPPQEEVRLVEPSSWSCPHGVERWRADCGCRMAPEAASQQGWRKTLREAMDWLAEEIHGVFREEAGELGIDPWQIRDDYGRVVAGAETLGAFLNRWVTEAPEASAPDRVRELLELERNALRLFTSCGWFFDDLAGIEPLQVLRYASRALELLGHEGTRRGFLDRLREASSNEHPPRSGETIFLAEEEARSIQKKWFPPGASEEGGPDLIQRMRRSLRESVSALESTEDAPSGNLPSLDERIRKVHDLAFLHTSKAIPIPFSAQTDFYRILRRAHGPHLTALSTLREPLGFVPDP